MSDEIATRKDIRNELLKQVKPLMEQMQAAEARGAEKLAKKLAKDDGTGMAPGADMAMNEEGEGASMMKDELCKSCGKMHKNADCYGAGGMAKDEDDMGSEATPCTGCGGPLMILGALGNREHSVCRNCGLSHSRDVSAEPGMAGAGHDDPMAMAKVTPPDVSEETMHSLKDKYGADSDKPWKIAWSIHNKRKAGRKLNKEEIDAVKAAPEKTAPGAEVPDGPGKEIEAEGSGSDPKKGKMAKGESEQGLCPECSQMQLLQDGKLGRHPGRQKSEHRQACPGSGQAPKMEKGDTWNPTTGAAEEQHVRGSIAAKMGAGTAAPKKSPKDIRGVPEGKIKPLAKGAMPGLGAANPPAQKRRILDRFKLGQGGTPAGQRVPLPGLTPPVRAPGTPPPR